MPPLNARVVFALACLAGVILVATVALIEILRTRRGESIISAGQLRLRMFSAVIWVIILGSLAYADLFLWPERGNVEEARNFLSVISGVVVLIVIGLLLLIYDVWILSQRRRLQESRFQRSVDELARSEIEKLRTEKGQSETHPPEEASPQ